LGSVVDDQDRAMHPTSVYVWAAAPPIREARHLSRGWDASSPRQLLAAPRPGGPKWRDRARSEDRGNHRWTLYA
ncbi:MAG TPA: hypothetical protein VFN61_04930, partial [Acidimicrobiales bacterium]|nr:hypothetical protein [Acidimicrobiales bacterium]